MKSIALVLLTILASTYVKLFEKYIFFYKMFD